MKNARVFSHLDKENRKVPELSYNHGGTEVTGDTSYVWESVKGVQRDGYRGSMGGKSLRTYVYKTRTLLRKLGQFIVHPKIEIV